MDPRPTSVEPLSADPHMSQLRLESEVAMNRVTVALVFGIGSAVLFSAKGVLVKLVLGGAHPMSPSEVLVWRSLLAFPFFAVLAVVSCVQASRATGSGDTGASSSATSGRALPAKRDLAHIALFGVVSYYASAMANFAGLQYISAGMERMVLYIYPLIVVLLKAGLDRRLPSGRTWIALALCYGGIATVFGSDLDLDPEHGVRGVLLVALSALIFAVYLVGSASVIPRVGSTRFTALAMAMSTAVVVGHQLLRGVGLPVLPAESVVPLVLLAIGCTVLPSFLMNHALGVLGPQRMSAIGSLGPLVTIGLGVAVLGEHMGLGEVIGMALVVGGVLFQGKG